VLLAAGCFADLPTSRYWVEGHVLYLSADEVAARMARLAEERFFPPPPGGEWVCGSNFFVDTLSNGAEVGTLQLDYQIDNVVTHNAEVVPVLIEYLNHEKKYVRYIAACALGRITGENPLWHTHGIPGKPFNGSVHWYENAVKTWSDWYVTAQPRRSTDAAGR
jgi:hypothetical protein